MVLAGCYRAGEGLPSALQEGKYYVAGWLAGGGACLRQLESVCPRLGVAARRLGSLVGLRRYAAAPNVVNVAINGRRLTNQRYIID